MNWIKKNYDQFLLAIFAAALIGVSVKLWMDASGFGERFSSAFSSPAHSTAIPATNTPEIEQAKQQLDKPTAWRARSADPKDGKNGGMLFTGDRYTIDESGNPKKVINDSKQRDSRTGEPIPNKWFLDFGLPALDPEVGKQDPDGDGFWNEDEWRNHTNPTSRESHPPYHTALYLAKWIKVPFRLKFEAWNTSVEKPGDFQINTLDKQTPTQFPKIGEMYEGTTFKLKKFEFKEAMNDKTGSMEDVSELTVVNVETNEEVVLVLHKVIDSPNQFGKFEYWWGVPSNGKPMEFTVPKLKEFVLKPDVNARYKLLDVKEGEALIQTPSGEKYTVPPPHSGPAK
jgi:hypothetical protein